MEDSGIGEAVVADGDKRSRQRTLAVSLLAEHRLTRSVQSAAKLPTVLWCVLLVGGALTIVSACTFGTDSLKLQALQVFSLSLLISLSLVAISDIHRPFDGLIRVSDRAFRGAQQTMQAP